MSNAVASAARKLPPLKPGEFRFVTNALTAGGETEGPRRFQAIASSTITDLAGNTIKPKALFEMRDDFRRGLTIFMDHDYTNVVDKVFGMSDSAEVVKTDVKDDRTGEPIYDLIIGGIVNEPNPNAIQLHDSIKGGYVKFGTSIGAIVRKHTRDKETGGMLIDSISAKEASIVGIPKNQRSWAYKASLAVADLPDDEDLADDEPEEETEQVVASTGETIQQWVVTTPSTTNGTVSTGSTTMILTPSTTSSVVEPEIVSGDLSSKARGALPDSEFACPEKRLYPINDAAHVRAALSRVADPSNDQCGKDKIMAAARKMGIGEHATKNSVDMTDDELLTWALAQPEAEEAPAEPAPDSAAEAEPTPGGQEAEPATPETAPATEDEADPAIEQQAEVKVEDVAELVQHVSKLVAEIGRLNDVIVAKDAEIATIKASYDRLESVEKDATETIRRVMELPLRRQAVGHVDDFTARYPGLDPRVTAYVARATKEKE